jgi:AcrR family transcriptional regulator
LIFDIPIGILTPVDGTLKEHPDRRSELLHQALELFASRGFDAVGVQEIVEAARVTKPTLYHYFGSKQGLLEALLGERFGALEQSLRTALECRHDLGVSLRRGAAALFRFAGEHPVYYRLQLSLWFAPRQSRAFLIVSGLNTRLQDLLEELFRRAVEDHGNMRGRERTYAASFLGVVNTYVALALNGYLQLEDQLVERVVHQFEHGIYS